MNNNTASTREIIFPIVRKNDKIVPSTACFPRGFQLPPLQFIFFHGELIRFVFSPRSRRISNRTALPRCSRTKRHKKCSNNWHVLACLLFRGLTLKGRSKVPWSQNHILRRLHVTFFDLKDKYFIFIGRAESVKLSNHYWISHIACLNLVEDLPPSGRISCIRIYFQMTSVVLDAVRKRCGTACFSIKR